MIPSGSALELAAFFLTLADDELILGHRDSEWCGHAPILEEDIAFANIALDELGHARLWYGLHASLLGQDPEKYPDRLVYFRSYQDFRCADLVTLPRGDWAFTILRQFIFDVYEKKLLAALRTSQFTPAAEVAAKIGQEEIYHLRHLNAWVRRLGLGTTESNRRMQKALDTLWPYTAELFESVRFPQVLVEEGLIPAPQILYASWFSEIQGAFGQAGLVIPVLENRSTSHRRENPHLAALIEEMQQVARLDPDAAW